MADIVDSPEGGLWACHEPGILSLVASWNFHKSSGAEPIDGELARFLDTSQMVVNLDQFATDPDTYAGLAMPEWVARVERAWLIVPLIHNERLTGFLVLGQPRAPRALNWEDYDLLKTAGRQVASYLAENQATRALAEARQFEAFNRRFAFVMHDIKNLVSQLSLVVKNASKHRGNPAFQEDMIRTVEDSVDKMNRLLVKLYSDRSRKAPQPVVDLVPLLNKLMAKKSATSPELNFESQVDSISVAVDEDRLAAVIGHLIQNAIEAVGDKDCVEVRLKRHLDKAIVEVEDHGPGMEPDFIRDELFRPFRSTKKSGYGIGAFECREFAREHGGFLDVSSLPGRGTTMRITLPTVGPAALDADTRRNATT